MDIPQLNLCALATQVFFDFTYAEGVCRQVLLLDPEKASAYFYLGRAKELQKKPCDAYAMYRLALEKAYGIPDPGFNSNLLDEQVSSLASQCNKPPRGKIK